MNKIYPYLPAIIALLLIGILYQSSNMMGYSKEYMDYLSKTINEVPHNFGDWVGTDHEQSIEAILKETGAIGQVSRTYENASYGEFISLYMIAGVSFRVAMHSPLACYPGSGFTLLGETQTIEIPYVYTDRKTGKQYSRKAEFFMGLFTKESHSERVFWAWNDGSGWVAPSFPRLHFGGHIPLAKCYFTLIEQKDSNPNFYDLTKINDFAGKVLSDLDNRLFIDGKLPVGPIEVKLGNPIPAEKLENAKDATETKDISESTDLEQPKNSEDINNTLETKELGKN